MGIQSDLLTQVLALPEAERAELVSRLLLSFESGEPEEDPEAAWALEISRRREAYEKGETTASPWREVLGRIEQTLRSGEGE